MKRLACIGESLIELSDWQKGQARLGFAGHARDTAVYLARMGVPVSYVSVLGNDPFSDGMLDSLQEEGVDTRLVLRLRDRLPGICARGMEPSGQPHPYYWREQSPLKDLLRLPDWPTVADTLLEYDYVYLAGDSLSQFVEADLLMLRQLLEGVRQRGGKVVLDSSYLSTFWSGHEQARATLETMLPLADISLSNWRDEQQLYGSDQSLPACIARLHGQGVAEVVIKSGLEGSYVSTKPDKAPKHFPLPEQREAVDLYGAGASYNAAYLAGRLQERSYCQSTALAQGLAAEVVMHPGSIIPSHAMPESG